MSRMAMAHVSLGQCLLSRVGAAGIAMAGLTLAACGGHSTPSRPSIPLPPKYTIGGSVSGLAGMGLALQNNGGDNLSVTHNGTFTFATALTGGMAYAVTVFTQPTSPIQACTVTHGRGTTASADVTSIAVNCASAGKFAYTASTSTGTIYAYTIDAITGALTQVGTNPDGTAPAAVSLAPNGKFAFSASDGGKEIHAFTIDQSTGALTEVAGSPYSTGFTVGSSYPEVAVDSQSVHLYLASAGDGEIVGFAIDPMTGALTAVGLYRADSNAGGIPAFSPDGKYLYVVTSAGAVYGYAIDSGSGALTALTGSPFPAGSQPHWIGFTPDGKFAYVSNALDHTISAYSVNAGTLTALSTPTYVTDGIPQDLTFDPAGSHLYVPVMSSQSPVSGGNAHGAIDAFTINSDGTLTEVTGSPWTVGVGPMFVDIDPTGRFAYVSSAGWEAKGVYGFTINGATGALTPMAGSPFPTGGRPQFITVDPSGQFGYTADMTSGTISGFAINQFSGVLTPVPNSPYTVGSATSQPFLVSISPEAPGIRD